MKKFNIVRLPETENAEAQVLYSFEAEKLSCDSQRNILGYVDGEIIFTHPSTPNTIVTLASNEASVEDVLALGYMLKEHGFTLCPSTNKLPHEVAFRDALEDLYIMPSVDAARIYLGGWASAKQYLMQDK